MNRGGDFLASLGAFAGAAPRGRGWTPGLRAGSASSLTQESADREYWLGVLARLAEPVLTNLAEGRVRPPVPGGVAPAGPAGRGGATHPQDPGPLVLGGAARDPAAGRREAPAAATPPL